MQESYIVDTHCHLWHQEFKFDIKKVVQDAVESGIKYLVNVGIDIETSKEAIKISKGYKEVFAACGCHPHYAKDFSQKDVRSLLTLLRHKKVVALGEVGLDFYRMISNKKSQLILMEEILKIWRQFSHLPIIIHNREAGKETIALLENIRKYNPKVIMHCFSGNREFLKSCLDRGYYISYATNVTYNKELQGHLKYTPLNRILLETDSPYLAPQSRRGTRNVPSNINESLILASEIKSIAKGDIMRAVALNSKRLFGIGAISLVPVAVYKYKERTYINLTNTCSNKCQFCIAVFGDCFGKYNLILDKDPSPREVLKELKNHKISKEVTFCGFGEPFYRFNELKKIAAVLKRDQHIVRIVTNGQGNLIQKRNVLPELKNIVDKISVSLNVENEEKYNELCRSSFGEGAFGGILNFVQEVKKYIPDVEITFLNIEGIDTELCKKIAQSLDVKYRIRDYMRI